VCWLNDFILSYYNTSGWTTTNDFILSSIRSSTYRFWVEVCGDLTTDSSTNSHCHPLVGRLPVLGLYFMLPIVKSLCFHRSIVCFDWLLGGLVSGNLHAPGSYSFLFVGLRVSRHWQQFAVQWCSCSYHVWALSPQLCKKKNQIKCCSHFCRCNKTLLPPCP